MQYHPLLIANFIINRNAQLHRPINNRILDEILKSLQSQYQIKDSDIEAIHQIYAAFGREPILGVKPEIILDANYVLIKVNHDTVNYNLLTLTDRNYINSITEKIIKRHGILQVGKTQLIQN